MNANKDRRHLLLSALIALAVFSGCKKTVNLVDHVDFNLWVPNDPYTHQMWNLKKIEAFTVWSTHRNCKGIEVGVIDTGVDWNHTDLSANVSATYTGYDYFNSDPDPSDDFFHGTHVAGTIGATGNNAEGVVGVCPQASLVSFKASNASGDFTYAAIVSSINQAISKNVKILNMSYGGSVYSLSEYSALISYRDFGGLAVAAAGNSNNNNDTSPAYPADYELANIISVGATDENDFKTTFSNFGERVDIGAPGINIWSTFPRASTSAMGSAGYKTHYEKIQGTSMAAPLVAGAAALYWSKYPSKNYLEVKDFLLANAQVVPALYGKFSGGRRLKLGTTF